MPPYLLDFHRLLLYPVKGCQVFFIMERCRNSYQKYRGKNLALANFTVEKPMGGIHLPPWATEGQAPGGRRRRGDMSGVNTP